jgi:hypothetical protein
MEPKIRHSLLLYKIQWYKKGRESAQDYLMDVIKPNEIMLHRWNLNDGRMWGLTTPENLLKIANKNKFLYEVLITDRQRKIYFDIDLNVTENTLDPLEECRRVITESFPEADLSISGSRTPQKYSYHIILSNWTCRNHGEMLCLVKFCTKWQHLGFDNKVYTKNRFMKLVNQSKPDKRVQEVIEGDNLSKHFITCFFDENSFSIRDSTVYSAEDEEVNEDLLDIALIPQQNLVLKTDAKYYDDDCTAVDKMWMIPVVKRTDEKGNINTNTLRFADIARVMIYVKQYKCTFSEFWRWCKQKDDSKARELKYKNKWEEAANKCIKEKTFQAMLLKFYPKLHDNVATRRFAENFEISEPNIIKKVVSGQYLKPGDISGQHKYTILASAMGSNKTGCIVKSLVGKKVLWITSRITLAQNTLQRLNSEGLGFVNYRDFTAHQKNDGILSQYENVICSVCSLHYLANNEFDVVVMDESESLLNTFSKNAKTHGSKCILDWDFLNKFVLDADKVYLMDAFTTKLTIDFINCVERNATIEHITTSTMPIARELVQHETFDGWVHELRNSLKNNKKVFVFTSFKSRVDTLARLLVNEFGWVENSDFIAYHGGKTEEKERLGKCEEVWGNPRIKCVITNSCITIGVNFNARNIFDEVYCHYNPIVSVRDFVQALYRVRFPNSLKMQFCAETFAHIPEYTPNPFEVPDDDNYTRLQKNLKIESEANKYFCKLETLQYFCSKANVMFDWTHKKLTSTENRRAIRRMLKDAEVYNKWDSIMDITGPECLQLGKIINSNLATYQMRLEFDKYTFKNKFVSVEDAEKFWNLKLQKLVYLLYDYIRDPFSIIRKIYDENDMVVTEPVKSNPELKSVTMDEVNKNFDFTHKALDKSHNLVRKIINAYFDREVVTLERQQTNNKYSRVTLGGKQVLKFNTDKTFLMLAKSIIDAMRPEFYTKTHETEILIDDDEY